jgi:hypothetical protein
MPMIATSVYPDIDEARTGVERNAEERARYG